MRIPELKYSDTQKKAINLLTQKLVHSLNGNYKGYKQATIDYANLAVKNFDEVKSIKSPKATISIFSPLLPLYAFRITKVIIRDIFRKKTNAEKTLKQLAKNYKLNIKG